MTTRQCALITGASHRNGIGYAIARGLVSAGWDVALGYLNDEVGVSQNVQDLHALGGNAIAIKADLRDPDECIRFLSEAHNSLGGLDLLVHAAASHCSSSVLATTQGEWELDLQLNLNAYCILSQFASESMIEAGTGGSIIFISSTAAHIAGHGVAYYAASKAAGEVLTRSLAFELGPQGIRANVVVPGPTGPTELSRAYMATPEAVAGTESQTPTRRLTRPVDVADAVNYLASPAASQVNGATVIVDGGYSIGKSQFEDATPREAPDTARP